MSQPIFQVPARDAWYHKGNEVRTSNGPGFHSKSICLINPTLDNPRQITQFIRSAPDMYHELKAMAELLKNLSPATTPSGQAQINESLRRAELILDAATNSVYSI